MSTHAIRLGPGAEVREALLAFVQERGIQAACVVSAVGSLTEVHPPPLPSPPPHLPPAPLHTCLLYPSSPFSPRSPFPRSIHEAGA